ncbi:uncharacterized protein JCM6883_003619 [Sporobolomyces salmoneus]|uniref:uncharacterized protein n=1 Tax=Sporobolomyces salmoneus TaxID=183962 RepID=UPI00316F4BC5
MATSTTLPGMRRLCALASPIPLASTTQLVKNSNVSDTWIECQLQSDSEVYGESTRRRNSLKRRREARTGSEEINNQQYPLSTRSASPTASGSSANSSTPHKSPRNKLQSPEGSRSLNSESSPTTRSAPPRSSATASSRLRLSRTRTHAPATSTRLHPSQQPRQFSTSSSQPKPALAYHDLVSNALNSTSSTSSTVESVTQRGTSTVAKTESEAKKETSTSSEPPRPSALPPRPPSPYGEINELIRHPTLYDPILKPRHPIVLCHGLYGFDVRGPGFFRLHYWGDMLKILRGKIGAEVYVTAVPGTGSVKNRAQVLHKSLEDTPSLLNRDINFVAHSMGGLDARYLISQIKPTLYHPRSLTTICTPHRGSEFMAWCRANIGIGTDLESSEASSNFSVTNSSSLEDPFDSSMPLPLTLKSPILSREQVEAAKKAALKAKEAAQRGEKFSEVTKFPGLPFNLSTTVTSYLLNLLDSPAYANLTPAFLRDVFNPTTPNLPDVKYYSIAGRTDKIPIWHPLWLPKVVLDGAERTRIAQGRAAPKEWRGNDGLVNVDSARWGEFLGTFDGADHWEMRGSSGLISAEASKHAVEEITRSEFRRTKEPVQGEKAERVHGGIEDAKYESPPSTPSKKSGKDDRGWQWQDVYALIGKLTGSSKKNGKEAKEKVLETGTVSSSFSGGGGGGGAEVASLRPSFSPEQPRKVDNADAKGLASAADWIVSQLPGSESVAGQIAHKAGDVASSIASTATTSAQSAASTVADSVLANPATRLLYGAPGASSSSSSSHAQEESRSKANAKKQDKFSLEDMTVALCRKLYNDGL